MILKFAMWRHSGFKKQNIREAAKNIKRLLERIQVNKQKYTSRPHYDKFMKEANKNSVQHLLM